MPFVRRRPLMRMAAVGGVAYMGSKAGTKRAMQQSGAAAQSPTAAQQQAAQPAQQQAAPPQPAQPAAPPPAAAGPESAGDRITQLQQLAQLHETGALSDEEFAQAKAKVLA